MFIERRLLPLASPSGAKCSRCGEFGLIHGLHVPDHYAPLGGFLDFCSRPSIDIASNRD